MPHTRKKTKDDLEPYRQLIEIQKQLAKLAKQHEKTRRECDVLREQVARELAESMHWKPNLRHRLRARAVRFLKRFPRAVAADVLRALNNKLPSSC